jgi:hypothetical protein
MAASQIAVLDLLSAPGISGLRFLLQVEYGTHAFPDALSCARVDTHGDQFPNINTICYRIRPE